MQVFKWKHNTHKQNMQHLFSQVEEDRWTVSTVREQMRLSN